VKKRVLLHGRLLEETLI